MPSVKNKNINNNQDTVQDKVQKLTTIHSLITTGSDSIELIKTYLIEEYQSESTIELMIISQIIDIFIRLNRLQSHIKFSVEYNRQIHYHKIINQEVSDYEIQLEQQHEEEKIKAKQKLLLEIIKEGDNENNEYIDEYIDEYNDNIYNEEEEKDNYYDWKTHNKLVNIKRSELEKKYYDTPIIDDTQLNYLMENENIRKEETHLINCLTKYINFLEKRKQESKEQRLKLELIKAQIKSQRVYDY